MFGMTLPLFGRRSRRAACVRGSRWTLWRGGSKPPLKRAFNRMTDKRASHAGGRPFLRPYPRTEPRKTAQRRAFEENQTPDQTPGGVTRPPRLRPRPALRGGVHGPRGPCDPRHLSRTFFDRAYLRCAWAPWSGAGSFGTRPRRARSGEGRGIAPAEPLRRQRGVPAWWTAREQREGRSTMGAALCRYGHGVRLSLR